MTTQSSPENNENRKNFFLEMLRTQPDEVTCQACLDRLDDYIAAQLAGQDYLDQFPDIAAHLDACLECAASYARLYELEIAVVADTLPPPHNLPPPDLSFLSPPTIAPLSSSIEQAEASTLAERLQQALHHTGRQIILSLSIELLSLLRPVSTAPVRTASDADRYSDVLLSLESTDAPPDFPLTLTAYRDAHKPGECLVEVIVNPPDRSWPDLEGIEIRLTCAEEQYQATTDAWGLASFSGLPTAHLADLKIEVNL